MKYTLEFKLECIDKYKKGMQLPFPDGINKDTFRSTDTIRYCFYIIDF